MAHPITPPPMMTASAFLGILIPHQGDVIILVIGLYHDLGLFRCQVSGVRNATVQAEFQGIKQS
jgi:hypothetical protein